MKFLAVGGNARANYNWEEVPNQDPTNDFDIEEARAYLDFGVIPNRLSVYLDQRFAPGNSTNLEANVRYWIRRTPSYVKAGRMYLPFGYRFEDDNAFVRSLSGINMQAPDEGVEFGFESGSWTAQLAVSNGAGGGAEVDSGKQVTTRAEFVQSRWRAGASLLYNDTDLGTRTGAGVFGAFNLGPVTLLGEVDYFDDESIGDGKLMATLAEADWKISAGSQPQAHLRMVRAQRRPRRGRADAHQPALRVVADPVHAVARRRAGVRRHSAERQPEPQAGIHAVAWLLLDHWGTRRTARMPASWSGLRDSSPRSCAACLPRSGSKRTRACSTSVAAWVSRHTWWRICSAARRRWWAWTCRCRICMRRAEQRQVGLVQADAAKLCFRDAAFDLIWSCNTVNHLSDPVAALVAMRAALRPAGRVVLAQSGFLPEMFFAWDAPLDDAVRRACHRVLPRALWTSDQDTARIRGLIGLLQRAGLRVGRVHTMAIERIQPLTESDRAYFEETIFRGTWGDRLRPFLTDGEWQALCHNTDPASPDYCLDREDFHHIQTSHVCEAYAVTGVLTQGADERPQ